MGSTPISSFWKEAAAGACVRTERMVGWWSVKFFYVYVHAWREASGPGLMEYRQTANNYR